jgi:hypothetical protein
MAEGYAWRMKQMECRIVSLITVPLLNTQLRRPITPEKFLGLPDPRREENEKYFLQKYGMKPAKRSKPTKGGK